MRKKHIEAQYSTSNVGKTMSFAPSPSHHFYRWYVYHSQWLKKMASFYPENFMVNPQRRRRHLHLHRQTHLREAPDFSSLQAELQGFGGRLPTGPRAGRVNPTKRGELR